MCGRSADLSTLVHDRDITRVACLARTHAVIMCCRARRPRNGSLDHYRLRSIGDVQLAIHAVRLDEVERIVDIALLAWEPVHASMAEVLGDKLNRRVYPDWAAGQAADVRDACADPGVQVCVAVDGDAVLGFVTIVIDSSAQSGEIDMIAVDPAAHGRGVGRALTEHALAVMRQAGCTLAHVATGGDPGHIAARALYAAAGFTALPLVRYYREL